MSGPKTTLSDRLLTASHAGQYNGQAKCLMMIVAPRAVSQKQKERLSQVSSPVFSTIHVDVSLECESVTHTETSRLSD